MSTSSERRQNLQRLQRELKALMNDPVPGVHATPLPANMLEWHYVIQGPEGSAYQGGYYHGIIKFPQEYPFKPPSIRMLTPSGRFEPNQRICLSMSDFHPETWNCMWSVSSILQGVVSFMLDNAPAIGTINTSEHVKRQLARTSMQTNCQCKQFTELFGDLVEQWRGENPESATQQQQQQQQAGGGGGSGVGGASGELEGAGVGDSDLRGAILPLAIVLFVALGVLVWIFMGDVMIKPGAHTGAGGEL